MMTRTDIINYLVRQTNARRYLEIGVHDKQNNFMYILCEHKVTTFPLSSQEFFTQNHEEFDIIFIDGVHTEEQALKDIENACRSLAKGGVIVIHDCMPPDAWHQREPEAFREGENWNGTVWKAVLRFFNQSEFKCSLLDTDWGCGIIDTAQSQLPLQRKLPKELNYEVHYKWLCEYKISVASYLRDQVKVFYHLACMGNWKQVFKEQSFQLQQNGFQYINLTVLGTMEDLEFVNLTCEKFNLKVQVIFQAADLTYFEKPALSAIEEYASRNEGYVLYLHSKGVSNPADETKVKWRRLMMHELVDNWEYCMHQLPHFDIIGVNWREMPPVSHFCGNFWYASTGYLRKLADFNHYYHNPRFQIWDAINHKRLGCEFWIGSGYEKPKLLSLYCKNVDFCNKEYWKDKFRQEENSLVPAVQKLRNSRQYRMGNI